MSDFAEFDRFFDEQGYKDGQEPEAFAAWLANETGQRVAGVALDFQEPFKLTQGRQQAMSESTGAVQTPEQMQAIRKGLTNPDESNRCELSRRVDGPYHSWCFDGDDPYIVCYYCGERRDAISGQMITPGRSGSVEVAFGGDSSDRIDVRLPLGELSAELDDNWREQK